MTKTQVLELLSLCPMWETDKETMEQVKAHFELAFKEQDLGGFQQEVEDAGEGYVSKREFKHEILTLHSMIGELIYEKESDNLVGYPPETTTVT